MKPKKSINKCLRTLLPILLVISTISLGFSSWVFSEEGNKVATINEINIESSEVNVNSPLKVKSVTSIGAIADNGIYNRQYETSTGATFEYLSPGASDFRIRWTFTLDNRLYKYYTSGTYFICVRTKLTFNGLYGDIVPYYGLSSTGSNDLFVLENGEGWRYRQDFNPSRYDERNRTQTLTNNREYNIKNNTPNARTSEFFLEYCFRNFASLIGGLPFNISLRIDLRYNQL